VPSYFSFSLFVAAVLCIDLNRDAQNLIRSLGVKLRNRRLFRTSCWLREAILGPSFLPCHSQPVLTRPWYYQERDRPDGFRF